MKPSKLVFRAGVSRVCHHQTGAAAWGGHEKKRGLAWGVLVLLVSSVWLSWGPPRDANDEEAGAANQAELAALGEASKTPSNGSPRSHLGQDIGQEFRRDPASPRRDGVAPAEGQNLSTFREGRQVYQLIQLPMDLQTHDLVAVDLRFERTLGDLIGRDNISLALNGGYWDTFRQPEGLLVSGHKTRVGFNPRLGGGVLEVGSSAEGGVSLHLWDGEHPPRYLVRDAGDPLPSVAFAIQCSPRLVVTGNNNIPRDDGERAARTALGIRGGHLFAILARGEQGETGREGPSLFGFATALVAHGYDDVLNLDGGPSSGAVWKDGDAVRRWAARTDLRIALALRRKPSSSSESTP